ncbi:YjdF family protein [Haloimpatiens sp. FM7330]|uniref:YjdF family protein n=1 Tax=Haloimpatiens sp. FM7330 TaxID=3298610 RepID=UPI0036305EF0
MIKLTVFFDDPFWIGVFEKVEDDKIEICRVVFGQEPKDCEIYEFVLKNYNNLKFSKPLSIDEKPKKKVNPKRMQRKIREKLKEKGIGTKAQQAIKLDYENKKKERKILSKERREKEKQLKFEKKQEKKKQKKRGH